MTLTQRRHAVEIELDDIRRAAGARILDGSEPELDKLLSTRAELEALEAAVVEEQRRERATLLAAEKARRDAARAEMAATLPRHRDAMKRAEKATRALVDAIQDVTGTGAALVDQCKRLGSHPPVALDPTLLPQTVSRLIAQELRRVGGQSYFGHMKWPSILTTPWSDHFDRGVKPALDPLIQPEGTDDDNRND